ALRSGQAPRRSNLQQNKDCFTPLVMTMMLVPAGPFPMGSNDFVTTLDNERLQHEVFVKSFSIDHFPVTNAEFLQFVEEGGYHTPALWSTAGWRWRERHAVTQPLYWRLSVEGWREVGEDSV